MKNKESDEDCFSDAEYGLMEVELIENGTWG